MNLYYYLIIEEETVIFSDHYIQDLYFNAGYQMTSQSWEGLGAHLIAPAQYLLQNGGHVMVVEGEEQGVDED